MSNTLETKTVEQLDEALLSYNRYMCEVPDDFPVLDEYLNGLTRPEFCAAFKKLQSVVVKIYDYLRENPQSIGLVKASKSGELKVQSSQHISCIKKLLYTIGRYSDYDTGKLAADKAQLMNAYMTYYSNCSVELAETINEYDADKRAKFFEAKHMRDVFGCLELFGFGVAESDGVITVTYDEAPALLIALKEFASLKICRVSFGLDFTKFNYRAFAYARDARLPLEDLYSYRLLPDEHKSFLSQLNRELEAEGASYGECAGGWYNGTLPCQYNYRNKVRILQNIECGLLPHVVVRFGKKSDRVVRLLEEMPEELRGRNGRCRGCHKGDCSNRVMAASETKKYVLCKVAWWNFPPSVDAVRYIVRAFKI